MQIQAICAEKNAVRVIVLGQFAEASALHDAWPAASAASLCFSEVVENLPGLLGDHDVLVTELHWLTRLSPASRADLARRAATVAGWIVVSGTDASFADQISWHRTGVSHFVGASPYADRLALLINDIGDRLDGPRLRVMIYAEEKDNLPRLNDMLAMAGIDTMATHDLLVALETMTAFRPDLLLVDTETGGGNGVALASLARQQRPYYASVPIIIMAATADMPVPVPARLPVVECVLNKPTPPALLVATIKSHALQYRAMQRAETKRSGRHSHTLAQLAQLRAALDEHALVSTTDLEGNIVHVNDRFCAVSGYHRDELTGQPHRILKSDKHSSAFYGDLWRTIGSGKSWHGEVCNRRKNGELYWVDMSIVPVFDEQGQLQQYLSILTDFTVLKRSTEALKVSDERLRRGQVFANIGTWDWNVETDDLVCSELVGSLCGYGSGECEVSFADFMAAVHPDDRQAISNALRASIVNNTPYDIEHRVVWPDGAVRWLQERGAVVRDSAGNAMNILGVMQDINVRKQAELALGESEQRLRDAQSLAKIGDWTADLETGEIVWSLEIFHIFGCDPDSFTPSMASFLASVHPDDRQRIEHSDRTTPQTGLHDVQHRIIRPDGSVRHVHELIGRTDRNAAGTLVKIGGTVQDITERVEIEATLRETEKRFTYAVEGAGDGIWDTNMVTGVMLLSGNYEAMLGFAKGEIPSHIDAWTSSVHADDLETTQTLLKQYLAGEMPIFSAELRMRCKDGSYKWILCRGTVVARDKDNQPARMIGLHSDITERKTIEAALVVVRESAERANRAKSDFLSSMSHELRTPMNAILGFAQILEYDSALNPDQQDNVHEILKGGHHLLELINEVLDLAKVESGRIDLSLESLDLADIVGDCIDLIQPLIAARQIALHVAIAPRTIIRADRTRFKQVLLNLLSNAVKYNRAGGDIRLGVQTGAGERLRITVTDTGVGIAPEHMAQLFQPFTRMVMKHSEIEGTGIGLTISRRLVELMGGEVGVHSQVGIGSTFWLDMPTPDELSLDVAVAVSAVVQPLLDDSRQFKVLCIDDNPVNLKLIGQMLGMRDNIHVLSAHTAWLGIELTLAHRPDLILLDINMPGMNGYQVLEVFKADAELNNIPVIAITANAMAREIERGREAGFANYLTKPIDVAQFLNVVDQCLAISNKDAA